MFSSLYSLHQSEQSLIRDQMMMMNWLKIKGEFIVFIVAGCYCYFILFYLDRILLPNIRKQIKFINIFQLSLFLLGQQMFYSDLSIFLVIFIIQHLQENRRL